MVLIGFVLGFISGGSLILLAHQSYLRTLQMIGEDNGCEKINGNWYRITKEESK